MKIPSHVFSAARWLTLAQLLGALAATPAPAADASVQWSGSLYPSPARPGEASTLLLEAKIPEGYHLYSMTRIEPGPLPLTVQLEAQGLRLEGDWFAPGPHVAQDPNFGKAVESYAGSVTHSACARVAPDLGAGPAHARLEIKGQICNDVQCVPLKQALEISFQVEAAPVRPDRTVCPALAGERFGPSRKAPQSGSGKSATMPLGQGLFSFLFIAFLAGLGALVTPCVFPMIPITVSFFSKFSKVSLRRSLTMAFLYALSIVFTFTLVGVAVSALFGAVGMQALSASPWFNLFLTGLLIVFAFNLFGLFEIQVPSALISRSSQKERELSADEGSLLRQAAGIFFMAVTFTLISFTCTVGFIGVVLAEAAKGHWFYPALGMLFFSLAFSLPFFFLAVFPSWADKLRGKSGDWMVAIKAVLGFFEFAGALKFLSNVDLIWQWGLITRPFALAVWVATFLTAALYLLRVFNLPLSDPDQRTVGPLRMFFAMCLLALTAYSLTGIRDTQSMGGWIDGWLPPAVYPGEEGEASAETETHGVLPWITDDLDRGREQARTDNRPLFIDFTGYTCTNCRYMEGAVFPQRKVGLRLEKMTRVRAYTDADNPVSRKQRAMQIERFGTAALPFYAILDPADDRLLASFASMTNDTNEFVAFLDKGLAAFQGATRPPAAPTEDAPPAVRLRSDGKQVDFEFPTLADPRKRVKLSSLRGQWVLLNFWASWCAPCQKELKEEFPPALSEAAQVKLVTVAFDGEDSRKAALAFARQAGLLERTALLGGDDINAAGLDPAFAVSESLPLTYLINPRGALVWRHQGSVSRTLLKSLLAQTRP